MAGKIVMPLADEMDAINLEMPARIPRIKYSADIHGDLVKALAGIDVRI